MSKSIFALIKVGKEEHLQQFRGEGLLFMNCLAAFRDLESDAFRGDRFEGCDTIIQPRDISAFTFSSPLVGEFTASPADLAGPVLIGKARTASCNIFCMFAITKPIDRGFDPRLFEVKDADSLICVMNPSEFIRRVSLAANEHKLTDKCRLVDYYDPDTYSGETGVFRKPATLAYQQEFRLAVWPGSTEPRRLYVGSLVDITTEIVPFSEANERFDFSTRSALEAGLSW